MTLLIAALVGLALGGVLNLVIYRLPHGLALSRRPHCTHCKRPLSWEALPLVGYLAQRGRCRYCSQPIANFFPLVEVLTAAIFALLFWRHADTPSRAILYALFSLPIIVTLFIDWLHHDIYYIVILPAVTIALFSSLLGLRGHTTFLFSLLGLGIGIVFFGLLYVFGQVLFRSEALGLGDVWLAGTIGAMAGFPGTLLALALGMILAGFGGGLLLLTRRGNAHDYMPYGVFLCLGLLFYLCFWAPWSF